MTQTEGKWPAIEEAYSYHKKYLTALNDWKSFRDENAQKIALWSSIFWTFQNAKHGDSEQGLDVNLQEMREAVQLPGEDDIDESMAEILGIDKDTKMSDFISGKLSLQDRFDEAVAGGQPSFVMFGRRVKQKRSAVESAAQNLHNHMFYGGATKEASDLADGERCAFQHELWQASYEGQVKTLKHLTAELAASQFGREILKKLVDPYVPKSDHPKTVSIRALFLFYPQPIWNGRIDDPVAAVPGKTLVKNGNNRFLKLDSNGDPYVADIKMANRLTILAGQLMPGLSYYQASEQGDLKGANLQLSMLVYMLDGGVSHTSWKRFKQNSGGSNPVQVFTDLTNAITAADTIVQEFGGKAASRYAINPSSPGGQAKLRQFKLYSGNFAGLMSLLGATWGAIAKANKDQLDFDMAGIYNELGNMHDAADLYKGLREMAGLEYDEVALKDGKFVKYSTDVDDATKIWGKTALDWVGKAFDVVDAFISAYTSYTAASEGEYDVAVLAGIGTALAIGGLLVGGWLAVAFALGGILIGYLQSWVADGAVTKWIRRSVFGDTSVSDDDNQNPSSNWFGFKGSKRIAPLGVAKQNGLNRQIAEFYNIMMPFELPEK
ncbi:MAG: hypothetical protein ABEI57_04620, partial [Halapricum sp.]